MQQEQLVENSLYTSATERAALIANKSLLTDAFLINVFGFLSLYKINDKRGNMKTYETTEGKLQLANIGDTNHDVSLVIKLAYEAGILQLGPANDLTRLLVNIKSKVVKGADLSDDRLRDVLSNIKYGSHAPTPAVKSVIDSFVAKTIPLTMVAPELWTAIKANKHLQPVIAEIKDLINKGQYQELFSKMRAGSAAAAPAPTTPPAPTAPPTNGDRYTHTQNGRNAFWHVAVDGNVMVTHYGKIGTDGTRSHKVHPTPAAAESALKWALKEKLGKGYVAGGRVVVDMTPTDKSAAAATVATTTAKAASATAAPSTPKGPSLAFMQELLGKWDKTEAEITDTFKKYGVAKTSTKADDLVKLIGPYTDFSAMRYYDNAPRLIQSGLLQACIKNQNLKPMSTVLGEVFMANSFAHGAKSHDIKYIRDAITCANYNAGTRMNLAVVGNKVREFAQLHIADYAEAFYKSIYTAMMDNQASYSAALTSITEACITAGTIASMYGLRNKNPQGILFPHGADKVAQMLYWLATSPSSHRGAVATHIGTCFAVTLPGVDNTFTEWLKSEIIDACPDAVVTFDGSFSYYSSGVTANITILKNEAGALPDHIRRFLELNGIGSGNKRFSVTYNVIDATDSSAIADAKAKSVLENIRSEGTIGVARWSESTCKDIKNFVKLDGYAEAMSKAMAGYNSFAAGNFVENLKSFITQSAYMDSWKGGMSCTVKLSNEECTKIIKGLAEAVMNYMSSREDSGAGYTYTEVLGLCAEYILANDNEISKRMNTFMRACFVAKQVAVKEINVVSARYRTPFYKWIAERAPDVLKYITYEHRIALFRSLITTSMIDFPEPNWEQSDEIQEAYVVLSEPGNYMGDTLQCASEQKFIKSLSSENIKKLVSKANAVWGGAGMAYRVLMWAAVGSEQQTQAVLEGLELALNTKTLSGVYNGLFASATGDTMLAFINKHNPKLSLLIKNTVVQNPTSLGAAIMKFSGDVTEVKGALNEQYLTNTVNRLHGTEAQRVISAASNAIAQHSAKLNGAELGEAVQGVLNTLIKFKSTFDKSFRDAQVDIVANSMIDASKAGSAQVDAAYSYMSGEAKRAVIDKLTSDKFMQLAISKITDKNQKIRPFMDLDDTRVKQMLKFNRVDVPTVRANSAAGSKFSELMKVIQDFEQVISHPKVTTANEAVQGDARTKFLDRKSVEYDKFNKYRHGSIAIRFLDEFDVNIPEQVKGQAKFIKEHPGTPMMEPVFHGTGSVAASMILRYGFAVIKSTDSSVVGRMLGDGIYFSTVLDKVSQYTSDAGYTRGIGTKGYIFQMSSAMGAKNKDYREAGTGGDSIRSPEWCVFTPNEQLLIKKAFLVEIISKNDMDNLKRDNKVNEDNVMEIMTFKEFLRESTDSQFTNCTTYTFIDGMIPMADGTYLDFEDPALKLPANVTIEPSAYGPMVCINHNDEDSKAFMVDNTYQFVNGDDFAAYSDLLKGAAGV